MLERTRLKKPAVPVQALSPVDRFDGKFWVKREDIAAWIDIDMPSGSKVRQYLAMAGAQPPGRPMLVGCSADSCMQIYVAAAAKMTGVQGIIYTAKRKVRSAATEYAARLGCEINEQQVRYLNSLKQKARARALMLEEQAVVWQRDMAIEDIILQCENVPSGALRVVVATGSGLTAAGVLAGLSRRRKPPPVIAYAVSTMAKEPNIVKLVEKHRKGTLPDFGIAVDPSPYTDYRVEALPDGTPLDPFYAAKAYGIVQKGDLFWTPGLRPVCAMPAACQERFMDWRGPGG